METSAENFQDAGYLVVRSAIDEDRLAFFLRYVHATLGRQSSAPGDLQVPGTPSIYGDFVMDGLLDTLRPIVEKATGMALYPTYSYMRLYKHGDVLAKHRDRPACQISASLCLGYEPETPWPLWLEVAGQDIAADLGPGDMLLYQGHAQMHWREAYQGNRLAQVFLHYVDQNGPHSEWKFDKRPSLKAPGLR